MLHVVVETSNRRRSSSRSSIPSSLPVPDRSVHAARARALFRQPFANPSSPRTVPYSLSPRGPTRLARPLSGTDTDGEKAVDSDNEVAAPGVGADDEECGELGVFHPLLNPSRRLRLSRQIPHRAQSHPSQPAQSPSCSLSVPPPAL